MKKIRIDIISLILVIICTVFLGAIGLGISIALLLIYIKTARENYKFQKVILKLCFLGIILRVVAIFLLFTMENTGIDGITEALIYGFINKIGFFTTIVGSILLLIVDNKKFFLQKKTIVTLICITISILLLVPLSYFVTTESVSENIPTVADFETELTQRGLKTNTTDYRLYGINNKSEKAISLSFKENNNEKYPLYVYSIIDYPWLIYYANGDIYAVSGKYYWDDHENEEKIIWSYEPIISEKENVNVYNRKHNRYEKGNTLTGEDFNYYSKNKSVENSVFIDIPSIKAWGEKIEKVDRIDKKLLDTND